MNSIKLIFAIWFGLFAIAPMVEAVDDQECSAAEQAAQKSYDRSVDAYNSGNKPLSVWHGKEFMDIYERNKDCSFIKALADNLNSIGVTKKTADSSSNIDLGDLMRKCQQCKAVLQTGGVSGSTGRGIQKID
ncbi:hypothetical protein [Pseudomonas fluorescens]|uniref:hypothetical protein n=1 Tax=Pseudomonas fluorescens TaxID=294 RepID=UPI001240C774|nr:hypothetical protein [Pseudomonas fluorescens]